MFPNFLILLAAAIIPLAVGAIYYNPKVLGTAWMNAAGLTEEKLKGANMPVIFIVSFIVSIMIGMILFFNVVHQTGVYSTLNGLEVEMKDYLDHFMGEFGGRFRTFGHGALHGTTLTLFFAFPVILINGMFERKSFKYTMIHVGYWAITLALMGGIICQWA